LKFDKNSTGLLFHDPIWGGFQLCLGGLRPQKRQHSSTVASGNAKITL